MNEVKKNKLDLAEKESKFNTIHPMTNVIFNILFIIVALSCVLPLIFVIIISFTDDNYIAINGYSFFPKEWSLKAYQYLFSSANQIVRSYLISILVTVIGAVVGIILNSTYAYVISRPKFKFRKFFIIVSFIPMIFNGGMVSSYLINVRVLQLKNTLWVMILPLAVSTFYIIVLRTFFRTTIPDSIIESANIDGANQFTTFIRIVLPISLPGLATIGLFLTLGYWNDWFLGMLYIDDSKLIPLQYLLMKIENNIQFILSNSASLGAAAVELLKNLPRETTKMAVVVIAVLPIACAYPFFQKYFISGLTIGAVKE